MKVWIVAEQGNTLNLNFINMVKLPQEKLARYIKITSPSQKFVWCNLSEVHWYNGNARKVYSRNFKHIYS